MYRRSLTLIQASAAAAAASGSGGSSSSSSSTADSETTTTTTTTATGTARDAPRRSADSLLGYPLRRAAATEMLYGGVRVNHLNQRPFSLHYTRSEELPPPSLERERHDLRLEMQLPRDGGVGYNNIPMNIQRQLDYDNAPDAGGDSASPHARERFHFGEYFSDLFHPERHHTSSLPYSASDTNNVLGLRLFPLNMHVRLRTEGVRIRTEDLLHRMRDYQACAAHGVPLQTPLPLHVKARLAERTAAAADATLYSGSLNAEKWSATAAAAAEEDGKEQRRRQHLRGAAFHPRPRDLSIFTRPCDLNHGGSGGAADDGARVGLRDAARLHFQNARRSSSGSGAMHRGPQHWLPLQVMKPIGQSWSASMRSSGTRGPSMQLMQERLDQKGFGWKRKSRSLWQQDVDTAGFRPHRYF